VVFPSALFLFLFLPITLAGYFLVRAKSRNMFLLVMSLLFYSWGGPIYIFLLLGSIFLNYVSGLLIHFSRRNQHVALTGKTVLIASIAANLALLFYFKYTNFFFNNVNDILQYVHVAPVMFPNVSLPIGISFITFQAMTYVIDIYRQKAEAPLNPLNCALYVALFPKIVNGPIVQYHDIAKQIASRAITRQLCSSGIQRFIFGLSKKIIIANTLGEVADKIFAVPVQEVTSGMAWLGIVCYTLQIYFDFSGYSDMAIGLGRMLGFEFLENFNFPYISQSIREFWRRWHISLSNWFRDYLYIPLGGNRKSFLRTYLNLWVVFFLCGLWHGAKWNFIIWGALHGSYLVIERLGWDQYLNKLWRPIRHGYALLLVIIGWVFFRAETLTQAVQYLASMFGFTNATGIKYYALFYCDPKTVLTLLIGCIIAMPIASGIGQRLQSAIENSGFKKGGQLLLDLGHYGLLAFLFCLSVSYLAAGTYNSFIYFRF